MNLIPKFTKFLNHINDKKNWTKSTYAQNHCIFCLQASKAFNKIMAISITKTSQLKNITKYISTSSQIRKTFFFHFFDISVNILFYMEFRPLL